MKFEIKNIELKELIETGCICVRTYNICENHELTNLEEILNYYHNNSDFLKFRNCGSQSNQELISLCNKFKNHIIKPLEKNIEKQKELYFTQSFDDDSIFRYEKIKNIELQELSNYENLSVRTCNICEYNDLDNLEKILSYFRINGNFNRLRNCGKTSNTELTCLCNKYKYSFFNKLKPYVESKHENKFVNIIQSLTIKQKAVLNNLVSSKYKNLSSRSSNALGDYLKNTITIKNLKECIFSDSHFEICNLKNIGKKSAEEINFFLKEIKELIELISVFDSEEELNRELFNTHLIKLFSVNQHTFNKIGENYDFTNGIPIFKTIHILIEYGYIFNEYEKIIFKQTLDFFENKNPSTLDETANRIGLTREKTIRLRNKLLDTFNRYFSFVSFFEKEKINFYNLDTTEIRLDIDQTFIGELAKNEMVNYNVFFINRIFSILLKDKYSLIGDEKESVKGKFSRKHHNWISTYLVSNNFLSIFDFEKLINDVKNRLSTKIEEDYKFHFQTYLLSFQKGDCFLYLNEISQIAEQILYNEFELIIDSEESIKFPKNSMKTIIDYIYETLDKANKPLTVYEIFNILNKQYSGISKSAEALRGSCQRDTRLIYFGRSSTYGLKIWEEKLENIKGGTMHDISEEFLLKFDKPKHIDEIAEYVSSYRNNVTSKNLFYNLKSAEHRRFIFLRNGFIGLVAKSYNTDLFPSIPKYYSNKKSWEKNYQLLELYILKNEHLPFSSGNEEEIRLYRFFNIQVRKLSELSDLKKGLIENLMLKYNYQKGTMNNMKWEKSYNELVSFLHKNRRMPSMQISNEQKLYGFFYRQRNLYKEERLTTEYLSRFLEVTEIIKNIAR